MRYLLLSLLCWSLACGDDDAAVDGGALDAPASDATADDAGPGDDAGPDDDAGPADDAGPGDAGDDAADAGSGSLGCTDGAGLEDGEHTFMIDGMERRYILRLPEGYNADRSWPLIFALHGNGGNTGYWDGSNADRNIREAFREEAILVIAEAIDNQWRDYDMDRSTWPARIELELNYFDQILQDVSADLCIDQENIFSMGFSGGGSYSGVLGCRRDYIRAIAVGGSVIYFEPKDCISEPAAWITIGQGEQAEGRSRYRDFFRDLGGCDAADAPDEGCIEYEGCNPETPVTYCTHPAGHTWPSIGTDATRTFFRQFYE